MPPVHYWGNSCWLAWVSIFCRYWSCRLPTDATGFQSERVCRLYAGVSYWLWIFLCCNHFSNQHSQGMRSQSTRTCQTDSCWVNQRSVSWLLSETCKRILSQKISSRPGTTADARPRRLDSIHFCRIWVCCQDGTTRPGRSGNPIGWPRSRQRSLGRKLYCFCYFGLYLTQKIALEGPSNERSRNILLMANS